MSCPATKVALIQPISLDSQDSENVRPLTVGDAPSGLIPLELAKNSVLGRLDPDLAWGVLEDSLAGGALELAAIERIRPR